MYRLHQLVRQLILGFRHRLSARQFFIFSSVLVGLSSGLMAIVLKYVVHKMDTQASPAEDGAFWFYSFLPLIGIFLSTLFINKILKGKFYKGTAEIQYNIVKNSSVLLPSQMYSHVITSAATVGFGGSTGLESPIVSTGAAIGSNYARAYTLSYKERTALLACGAAAGIAAAFNAPIAGVLFSIEAVLADISLTAFIPLIIAAASGALLSKMVLQDGFIMQFSLRQPFDYHNVPFYVLLGLLSGLLSLYFAWSFVGTNSWVLKFKNPWARVALGGIFLAILIMLFPPLFGEGYNTVSILANLKPEVLSHRSILHSWAEGQWPLLAFLILVMVAKPVAVGLTLGGGGNGGNFGPALFIGSYLGFSFARFLNLSGFIHLPETNFALVGMAGVLSGVFYAPMTGIFLIAEITGGYELMIPLMIVSALSLAVVKYFEPLSMEAKKLANKLKHSIENRDQFLLSKLELTKLIETDFVSLHTNDTLQALVMAISKSPRNTFPVLNSNNQLMGLIHLDHVRSMIFHTELYTTVLLKDIMVIPAATIAPNEKLNDVLKKFDDTHLWSLPVVEDNQYVGFVSKSSILSKYRNELVNAL